MPGTWEFFIRAKQRLGQAAFNFDTAGAYKLTFHTSSIALSDGHDFSTIASLSTAAPRLSANNLSRAGYTLSSNAWFASGSGYAFCCNGVCVSANGGAFNNLKYAVIRLSATNASAGEPILFAQLTTTGDVTVSDGSAIKINGGPGQSSKIFSLA